MVLSFFDIKRGTDADFISGFINFFVMDILLKGVEVSDSLRGLPSASGLLYGGLDDGDSVEL